MLTVKCTAVAVYGTVGSPRNNRKFYWRKEVGSEVSSFRIVPGKSFILFTHEVV
jgi:hypothetical protein